MNRLSIQERARILACIVEGNSLRATQRITGFSKKGVTRFSVELGHACEVFATEAFQNLNCQRIQCDEIWAFVGSKARNTNAAKRAKGQGDAWTWVAIDPETKLIPYWTVGDRTAETAYKFMRGVAKRIKNRLQLTTDGHRAYLIAVEAAFCFRPIDYAQVVKIYGHEDSQGRYSPAQFVSEEIKVVSGKPDLELASTSHVERQNLTMRMSMRRFTRLTNAFSKKLENHRLACAVHFVHYNFCRVHQTLRCTPAMQAGLTDHVWSLEELAALAEPKLALAA